MSFVGRCIHCGEPLRIARSGRPRLYCSNRCRVAEQRRRRRLAAGVPESAEEQALREMLALPADPDEALAQALLLARSLVAALRYLVPRSRAQFAGRCAGLADDLAAALEGHFPECVQPGQRERASGRRMPPAPLAQPVGLPAPPPSLPPEGRGLWEAIVSELAGRGTPAAGDLILAEMLAVTIVRHRQARELLADEGLLAEAANGQMKAHPAVRVERDEALLCARLAEALGLSPAARVRLGLLQVASGSMLAHIAERVERALAAGNEQAKRPARGDVRQ